MVTDGERLFPRRDRVLLVIVALEFIAWVTIPLGPLIVAAVGSTTTIRRSRHRMVGVWSLAAVLTLIVLVPFVLHAVGAQSVDLGPVGTAT